MSSNAEQSIGQAPEKRRLSLGLAIALTLWAGSAAAGMGWLLSYKSAPGRDAIAPATWPASSQVALDPALPSLVMVVHPKCSCSRASIGELAKIMTRLRGKVAAHVLLVRPREVDVDWANTDLYTSAAEIPGVEVRVDDGGLEAQRFGALTSGQAYVYGADGRLLFSGGITASRGHHGDNAGATAIASIVLGQTPGRADRPTTNVYGCELSDPKTPGARP